jgi:hypothetical protein
MSLDPKANTPHLTDDKAAIEHYEELEKPDYTTANDNAAADQFGTNTVYSPEEKKLVRRLDSFIMPIVFCMYFMNKLDQNAIANARLDGFEKDLGLKGNQFNICVSVLYAGYTLIQVRVHNGCLRLTTDPFQHAHVDQARPALGVDVWVDDVGRAHAVLANDQRLGSRVGLYCRRPQLSRRAGCPIALGLHRSAVLPRCTVPVVPVLHQARDCDARVDPLQ